MHRAIHKAKTALVSAVALYFGGYFGFTEITAQQPAVAPQHRSQQRSDVTARGRDARRAKRMSREWLAEDLRPKPNVDDIFQALDYSTRSKLGVINRLLAEENYEDATRMLDDLLSRRDFSESGISEPEDYFLHSDGGTSLKQYIQRRLGAMPEAGRQIYEFRFGAKARKLLAEGLAERDMSLIEQASRRYFHTNAGYQATMLLARHHMSQSRPLAAALCLDRLYESPAADEFEPMLSILSAVCFLREGMTDHARESLAGLTNLSGHREPIVVAGQPFPLFTDNRDALAWLKRTIGPQSPVELKGGDDWPVFRGSPSRNAKNRGDGPLMRRRWQSLSYVNEDEKNELRSIYEKFLANRQAALPTLHALAVRHTKDGKPHDIILYRTLRHLMGVDFKSGKVLWLARTTFGDDHSDDDYDEDDSPAIQLGGFGRLQMEPQGVKHALIQRMWQDATYGTISSDGTYVYAVEDLGYIQNQFGFAPRRRNRWTDELGHNRLSARGLSSNGDLKWHLGGEQSRSEPKLAGAFFLGPPLPVDGTLYAIAEINREIRLVALAPDTGKLRWQQQLMPVKRSILQSSLRRKAGATPSFADGVLVCPTSAGAVVAIDLSTRSLLWGYHYTKPSEGKASPWAIRSGDDEDSRKSIGKRWADATVTIAEGRVLITPVESKEIHCLNLLDGSKAWPTSHRREKNLYIASVHKGIALLVGTDQLVGLRLKDGSPAFPPVALARDQDQEVCMPSGQGFHGKDHYFLPTTTGEVLKIDIVAGQIVERARARDGHILGNLICFQDEVISLGVNGLESFYQISPLQSLVEKRLKNNANDPWALARLGQIKQERGKLAEAIDCYRRSHQMANQSDGDKFYTGQMLAISLIDALETDFAANRHTVDEVERLVDLTVHRDRFERAMAIGLGGAGETLSAFGVYMRIYDQNREPNRLQSLGKHQQVRKDRWVHANLKELYETAEPTHRREMDLVIADRLRAAMQSEATDVSQLRRFVNYLGGHPLADQARLALAVRFMQNGHFLAAEQILLPVQRSADRQSAGGALGLMARLMVATNHPRRAADCYRRLKRQYSDVISLDGQTGQELYAERPEILKRDVAKFAAPSWPTGMVHEVKLTSAGDHSSYGREVQHIFDLAHRGPRGPFFENISLRIDRSRPRVIARDSLGHPLFSIALTPGESDQRTPNPLACHAQNLGHLLVVSTGSQIFFLNTLNHRLDPSERVLWSRSLVQVESSRFSDFGDVRRSSAGVKASQQNMPWGESRYQSLDIKNVPVGKFCVVDDSAVCYQLRRKLICTDPLRGDMLWANSNLPAGCDLFGDDQFLFAVPPKGNEAFVFRAIDGEPLGRRTLPSQLQRMETLGRRILCWREIDDKLHVALFDPWTGKYAWKIPIAIGSKGRMVSDQHVAVMEPDGRFRLLVAESGKSVIDRQLESERNASGISQLQSIHWMPGLESDILVVNRNRDPRMHKLASGKARIEWVGVSNHPGAGGHAPLVTGRIYSFDSQSGKPLWQVPGQVAYQGLVLNQPRHLPVLVFVRHNVSGSSSSRSRRSRANSSILCLDRRTGRSFGQFTKNDSAPYGAAYNMQMIGDLKNHTVTLFVPNTTASSALIAAEIAAESYNEDSDNDTPDPTKAVWLLKLSVTDEPMPPEPPVQLGEKKPRPPLNLGGLFRKLFGGGS